MTSGKVIGRIQIAGAPSCAPQIPTATIAIRWSMPVGWVEQTAGEAAGDASLLVRERRLRQCEGNNRSREGSGDAQIHCVCDSRSDCGEYARRGGRRTRTSISTR